MIIWSWPPTLNNNRPSSSYHGDQLYQVVRSWGLWFSLYSAYNVFLLRDKTTFDQQLWKTIIIFLSSWWSIVPSCMIMELKVHSVSCLQYYPTMWQYDLDRWPTTLKNNWHLPLNMVINCTKLYDPGAINGSFCILPTTVFSSVNGSFCILPTTVSYCRAYKAQTDRWTIYITCSFKDGGIKCGTHLTSS